MAQDRCCASRCAYRCRYGKTWIWKPWTHACPSLLAGLMSVALTSAAYGIQTISTAPLGAFLGPFGWVDLSQYLTFVPVALFTGLVTQFVFEELTLPASVWSPEQE